MLEQQTVIGCLVSLLLFSLLYFWSIQRNEQMLSNNVSGWIHILIMLFCVFAFWGTDYYHYKDALSSLDVHYSYDDQFTHLENLYLWLYDICGRHYTLFRLVVWGMAYLFFVIAAKKLDIYNNLTFTLFVILFLLTFSYARVSLGMASFFLACILLFDDKNRGLGLLLGVLCLVLAYFSHKSMIALLCLLPLSLVKYKRWLWILALAFVGSIVYTFSDYITAILFSSTDVMADESELYDTFEAANHYNESITELTVGVAALLERALQYSSILLPLIMMFGKNCYNFLQNDARYRTLYNAALLITIVAFSFGFLVSFNSPMCYRYLYMAYLPIVLLVSLLYKEQLLSRKQLYFIIVLGSVSVWNRMLYVVYNAYVSL